MAALVAPLCVRYSINGTMGDSTWTNIWDVRLLGTGGGGRAANIEAYAGVLFDVWGVVVFGQLCNAVVLNSVSWVDLNDLDGSTGEVTQGPLEDPNLTGARIENPLASNTAMLVRKATTAGRGTRPGRIYVIGGSETQASETNLVGAYRTQVQAAFDTALPLLTDPVDVEGASVLPTVIHTRNDGTEENPNIVYNGDSLITGLAVESRLATQRRRLRR